MTAKLSPLEQSFAAICEKHDLLSASMIHHRAEDERHSSFFSISLQWRDDAAPNRRGCAQHHAPTIAEALGYAVADMLAQRKLADPIALADEALPEIAA